MRRFLALLWLCLGLAAGAVQAADACRVAYDMGSSGIRAGMAERAEVWRSDRDFLALLGPGGDLRAAAGATTALLRELAAQGAVRPECRQVGGGFSAWRLALERDRAALADTLAAIRRETGVAVLVMSQRQEGAYAFASARSQLGPALATRYVLDIGGGSLQVAGKDRSLGAPLGQKLWQRDLCRALRPGAEPCELSPLTADDIAQARRFADERLQALAAALPRPATLTAVSRPVTRGIYPVYVRRAVPENGPARIDRQELGRLIERLAPLAPEALRAATGTALPHAAYLLSDMLLVEGILRAAGAKELRVAESDLTNLPGLLADERAYRWEARYACYLERLAKRGTAAYDSDPATCRR